MDMVDKTLNVIHLSLLLEDGTTKLTEVSEELVFWIILYNCKFDWKGSVEINVMSASVIGSKEDTEMSLRFF